MKWLLGTLYICTSLFFLTSCGKKGPLYLPVPTQETKHAADYF